MRPPTRLARRDILRTAGAAVGVFIVVNLIGEAIRAPFDTLGDWIAWPTAGHRRALALFVAAALLASALVRHRPPWMRHAAVVLFTAVACLASADTARFLAALGRGEVSTPAVLPASALVATFFTALAREAHAPRVSPAPTRTYRIHRLVTIGAVVLSLPLVRMATFGPTRYERPADCAVVFGARVYSTGQPSLALADRVDEAVRLYRAGLVKRIVMSGAIDHEAGHSEPAVMRDRAEAQGVPRDAMILDELGDDTASTVRNTARIMRQEGLSRALVVTHYYHEPRAKMLFDRTGIAAFTVPAHMSRRLVKEPYFLLREVAAYYHSYLLE